MIYRVKDPKRRNLVNELLSVENFKSSMPNPEIKVLFVVDTVTRAQIFLEAEPVQELADGWHPYPQVKPQKDGKYLCVWKYQDGSIEQTATTFHGKKFVDWNSNIFGWRELPKVWKGD